MSGTTTADGARATLRALDLPFREAIAFIAQKTNQTSQSYLDVWAEAHSSQFMVAGAATDSLVQDFREAVTKALEQGTTLADFRKDFDRIVAANGWDHTGTPGWRARIIFETNLSTAYSAGRYAQATEPDTLAVYPYWRYVHSRARNPREQHVAWDGRILRADDPWWRAHYPPNGWRCGCRVDPVSARELQRLGRDGPDPSPRVVTRPWTNPRTGETRDVPLGIDPGFDYNPGQAWKGGVRPEIPADAVLRAPPADWPPPAPAVPLNRLRARPPATPADQGEVTLPWGDGTQDVPIPPPSAAEAAEISRTKDALRQRLRQLGAPVQADEATASVQALRDRVADWPERQALRQQLRALGVPEDPQEDRLPLITLRRRVREARDDARRP